MPEKWKRHGECNKCGWCCTVLASDVHFSFYAIRGDGRPIHDKAFFEARGLRVTQANGMNRVHARGAFVSPCPQLRPDGCGIYATRPEWCSEYPVHPKEIVGSPCSYWFSRDTSSGLEAVGGEGSPYPTPTLLSGREVEVTGS